MNVNEFQKSATFGNFCEFSKQRSRIHSLRSIPMCLVRYRVNPERPGDLKECFEVTLKALHDDMVSNICRLSLSLEFLSNAMRQVPLV